MSSSQISQSQSRQVTKTAIPVPVKQQQGRSRIRSHLSVLDDNVSGQRRSKSSTSSQGNKPEEAKVREVQKPEAGTRLSARKTTRVFRNSRTKEETLVGGRTASLNLTYTVQAQAKETNHSKPVEERRELPPDVLNVNIAEGLYEYHQDVHSYLKEVECHNTLSQDYLENDSITPHMRTILVDWLTQVQHHLKVSEETLYRTVHTLDLVVSLRSVEPTMLQLVGVTSMIVASKLEEYYPIEISKMLHLTENSYRKEEVLRMERIILELVGFKFITPSPQAFLPRFTRAALRSAEGQFYSSCTYLLDCHLLLVTHSCLPPSHLAAAAVLAVLCLYKAAVKGSPEIPALSSIWTPTLVHYTSYSAGDLLNTATEMVSQLQLQASEGSKFSGAHIKYKSRSQHQQLALADHMKVETARRAEEFLLSMKLKK